jgi:hypothetical protein
MEHFGEANPCLAKLLLSSALSNPGKRRTLEPRKLQRYLVVNRRSEH